jgi:hypothetical protein
MVKGKSEPIPVFKPYKQMQRSVLWDKVKQSIKKISKVYGRKAELAGILQSFKERRGVVVLEGDTGLGKTLLLDFVLPSAVESGYR